MLADALFDESTIQGLEYYAENGFSYFSHTVRRIRNWWDTLNVKIRYRGEHKRRVWRQLARKSLSV